MPTDPPDEIAERVGARGEELFAPLAAVVHRKARQQCVVDLTDPEAVRCGSRGLPDRRRRRHSVLVDAENTRLYLCPNP